MSPIKTFHRTGLAAVLALAVTGPTVAAEKVRLGVLAFTSHSAAFIAHEKGYFREQGIESELVKFQAAGPMAVAIASGDIDHGVTAIPGALINLAEKYFLKWRN